MDDEAFTTGHRALHGARPGMLTAAWRRCAEQALHDDTGPPRGAAACASRARWRSLAATLLTIGLPLVMAGAGAAATLADCGSDCPGLEVAHVTRHDAVQAFLAQRYATAYGRFALLADGGDRAAALLALAMVCQGPEVFGSAWSATPGQLSRWSALAAREVAARSASITEVEPGDAAPRRLGDHPAVVVQRLAAKAGYDYASKFYPHPAWLRLHASAPRDPADDSVRAAASPPGQAE